MNDARICTDCGATDLTVLIATLSGTLCRACFAQTTRTANTASPPTPVLDAHIARIEQRERARR